MIVQLVGQVLSTVLDSLGNILGGAKAPSYISFSSRVIFSFAPRYMSGSPTKEGFSGMYSLIKLSTDIGSVVVNA
jgi:hypothetical protein